MSSNTTTTSADLARWHDATYEVRRQRLAEEYDLALASIRAERESKVQSQNVITETQRQKARSIAKGVVTGWLYWLPEAPDGTPNPYRNDPVWGWGSNDRPQDDQDDLGDLVAWLERQEWSNFARDLVATYRDRGSLSPKQIDAARSMRSKVEKRNAERAEDSGIDLSAVPAGMYADPQERTRLKVRIDKPAKGKWAGWAFVKDGAVYNPVARTTGQAPKLGQQPPGGKYRGSATETIAAIAADPQAAMAAYGRLVGVCGNCGRHLEDAESIEAGIGPVCRRNLVSEHGWAF